MVQSRRVQGAGSARTEGARRASGVGAAGMPTFAAAAARVLEQKRAGWRNTRHPASWLSSLERYAFPCIGSRPVSEVSSADVLEILTPIWHAKAQTARRGHWATVRSCFPAAAGSRCPRSGCAGCSRANRSRPCRTGSARPSGTARSVIRAFQPSARFGLRRPGCV